MMQPFDPDAFEGGERAVDLEQLPGRDLANDEERAQAAAEEPVAAELRKPRQPTAEEYDKHQLTHLPYQDWCLHCQRVKARERRHVRRDPDDDETHTLNVIHWDYLFFPDVIGADDDNIDLTIKPHTALVGYDADSGSMFGTVVTSKGKSDKYALGAARNWVRSLGLTSGVFSGDGESSLQDFLKEVARGVEVPLQVRATPLGDKLLRRMPSVA
jgi:hypothetical protein